MKFLYGGAFLLMGFAAALGATSTSLLPVVLTLFPLCCLLLFFRLDTGK